MNVSRRPWQGLSPASSPRRLEPLEPGDPCREPARGPRAATFCGLFLFRRPQKSQVLVVWFVEPIGFLQEKTRQFLNTTQYIWQTKVSLAEFDAVDLPRCSQARLCPRAALKPGWLFPRQVISFRVACFYIFANDSDFLRVSQSFPLLTYLEPSVINPILVAPELCLHCCYSYFLTLPADSWHK